MSDAPRNDGKLLELAENLTRIARGNPAERKHLIDGAAFVLASVRFDARYTELEDRREPAAAPQIENRPGRRRTKPASKRTHKPRKRKAAAQNEKPQAAPQRPALAGDRAAPVTFNGVSVDVTTGDESVTFKGKTIEVKPRQAEFVIHLARGMPHPIGREHLIRKMFPGCSVDSGGSGLSTLTTETSAAMAAIGLEAFTVRGVGVVLRPLEAE